MRAPIAALFLGLALAGCVEEQELGPATYTLTAESIPSIVAVNTTFTFALGATGDLARESDHIGAHYWTQSTGDPTADFTQQAGACQHLDAPAAVRDTHTVACTFGATGTFYLRGHIRIAEDDQTFNYWSPEHPVRVVDYQLTTEGTESSAAVGEDYDFTLHIGGPAGVSSDHIGAHYWDEPVDDPTASFSVQAGGCSHTAGDLPGSFQVTCNWSEAGEYTLHGHLRITSEDHNSNFWAPAVTVTVS